MLDAKSAAQPGTVRETGPLKRTSQVQSLGMLQIGLGDAQNTSLALSQTNASVFQSLFGCSPTAAPLSSASIRSSIWTLYRLETEKDLKLATTVSDMLAVKQNSLPCVVATAPSALPASRGWRAQESGLAVR